LFWSGVSIPVHAEIGFVRLDDPAFATEGRFKTVNTHRFHDAVVQKPSGIVLTAKLAMKLMGAKAFFRRGCHRESDRP
jgi:hypothetical protein